MADEPAKAAPAAVKFVTVACKLPNGFILHVDEMETYHEQVLGGGVRESKRANRSTKVPAVTLNGCAFKHGQIEPPAFIISGGYALTDGVPADLWNEWLKQNADSDLVRNKIIMAHAKGDSAAAMAKEHKTVLSGLEPITPNTDRRIPKSIKTDDGRKAA